MSEFLSPGVQALVDRVRIWHLAIRSPSICRRMLRRIWRRRSTLKLRENLSLISVAGMRDSGRAIGGGGKLVFETSTRVLNLSDENETLEDVKLGKWEECDEAPDIRYEIDSLEIKDRVSWPNGPECGPRCWKGSVNITADKVSE